VLSVREALKSGAHASKRFLMNVEPEPVMLVAAWETPAVVLDIASAATTPIAIFLPSFI
jgi:hypothetical protein